MRLPLLKELVSFQKEVITTYLGVRFDPWPLCIVGLLLILVSFIFMPGVAILGLQIAFFLAPLWMPPLLIRAAWRLWIIYQRSESAFKQKYILLEIKPPRNLVKTPLAMETFLTTLHYTGGEGNWWDRFKGGHRPYFSLEMASLEGKVHLYIWARANFRRLIESQLYAQYPGVQVVEAPDYTRTISGDPSEWIIWGTDFKKTEKNPIPIKTYVEFGLDKVQKEPEQVDPMANLVEYLGAVGKGEYIWLQFVLRAHRGERYGDTWITFPGGFKNGKAYTWKDEGKEIVEAIRKETRSPYADPTTGKEMPGFPNPTKGQSEKMAAIERSISKLAFDVGMRCIYFAKKEHFNPITIGHMINLMKPFNSEGWNGLNSSRWMKGFDDYPWELWVEKKKDLYRRKLVEHYRRRQFFHDPFPINNAGLFGNETAILSAEELATLFHIPSQTVATPGLSRVQSSTSEAPTNLPI